MDPLSIISGVIAVSGAAISASKSLLDIVDTIKNAPEEITAISKDTHAFSNVVSSLEMALLDHQVKNVVQGDPNMTEVVEKLKEPLQNCSTILGQLKPRIQNHLKPADGGGFRISKGGFTWLFARQEVKEYMSRLEATKTTLDSALTSVVILCSFRAANRAPDAGLDYTFRRRPSTDTDAGFALRGYVDSIAQRSPFPSDVSSKGLLLEDQSSSELTPDESRSIKTTENPFSAPESSFDIGERLRRSIIQRYALHKAAKEGDDLIVLRLLAEGTDVDIKDTDGKTALHLAAEFGNEAVVQTLLQNHATVNAKSSDKGPPMERRFVGGRTPLHWAAACGYEDIIRLLLEHHADPAITNVTGRSALQEAIKDAHHGSAKLLIEHGAPILSKNDDGWSALHEASFKGRVEICKLLLAKGAELDAISTDQGATPLLLAVWGGSATCVEYLMSMGANIRTENMIGDQPIHVACWRGFLPVVRMLLDAGIDIEVRDSVHNETPLLKAASTGKCDVILFLLQRGADVRAKNHYGRDALQHARLHEPGRHDEAVRLIQEWISNHK